MKTKGMQELILDMISAASEDSFDPEAIDKLQQTAAELDCTIEITKKGLVLKALEASSISLEDLKEYTGSEDEGEIVDGLIESLQAAGKKITGDLAQTSVGSPIAFTGTTTTGSAVITSPSSVAGLVVGQAVTGAGIPAGATISLLSPLTLTANATATASGVALVANPETQVIGLAEWTIDWKRKTAEATTTDDSAYESSVGSTASWTAKAKYMYIVGDTSQSSAILAAITSPQAAQPWNFFPEILTGGPAYTGLAYVDGITIAAGVGKIVGLDVSLKGTGPLTVGTQAAPVANSATITGQQAEV